MGLQSPWLQAPRCVASRPGGGPAGGPCPGVRHLWVPPGRCLASAPARRHQAAGGGAGSTGRLRVTGRCRVCPGQGWDRREASERRRLHGQPTLYFGLPPGCRPAVTAALLPGRPPGGGFCHRCADEEAEARRGARRGLTWAVRMTRAEPHGGLCSPPSPHEGHAPRHSQVRVPSRSDGTSRVPRDEQPCPCR